MLLLLLALAAAPSEAALSPSAPPPSAPPSSPTPTSGQSAAAPDKPGGTVTENAPPPEAPPRKRIEIGRDNVDLSGAGKLEFAADSAAVIKLLPGLPGTSIFGDDSVGGEIVFNRAGKAIACNAEHEGDAKKAEEELCSQIMARARFVAAPGYALPFDVGRLAFDVRVRRVMAPARPIRFLRAGKGRSLAILDTGKPGLAGCSILDSGFGEADSAAVCKAWIAAGKPGLGKLAWPPGARRAVRTGGRTARPARTAPQAGARTAPATRAGGDIALVSVPLTANRSEVKLEERMLWKNVDIAYPPLSYRGITWLSKVDGTLRSKFDMMDYPRLAFIEEVGGSVQIMVGFEREGLPVSCRPLTSSGTAYLDNQTCVLAMSRLRFDFEPGTPPLSGTRYYTTSVRWLIPSELND